MFTGSGRRKPDVQFRLNNLRVRKDLCGTCSFLDDEEFTPAHYDLKEDDDWLKSKHRILLYPSSNEDKFLKRKMVHPVPKATGPRDSKGYEDDYHVHNFDWKGKRGSFGLFETKDLAHRNNVHPLRLLYPKTPESSRRNTMRNSSASMRFHSHDDYPQTLDNLSRSKSDSRFDAKTNNVYEPAKYYINDKDSDWIKSKHRTLLYPSSREEAFLKRKMSHPVPKALGPRDVEDEELPSKGIKYNWKGKRGSVGDYETIDLDKNNIYPLRLMYPKSPRKSKVKLSNVDDVSSSWIDGSSSGNWKRLNSKDLNFEADEAGAIDKYGNSYESSETGVTERPYKWKGMHGSLGDYEAVNSSCNGSIYPLRLWYSKSDSKSNLDSVGEVEKTPKSIPKLEERSYDWKGKRGSIGDFETITPSSSMSSFFPLRMLYPKRESTSAHSSPKKSKQKTKTKVTDIIGKTAEVEDQEFEERSYDWKGKRGSIGLFETVSASSLGNIFPLRMIYPKTPQHANRSRSFPNSKKNTKNEGNQQKLANRRKSFYSKSKYSNDRCDKTSGTITPLDTFETHELSDDQSRSMVSVIKLASEEEVDSCSLIVPPNIEIPEQVKEAYYWKGKRGSIGDFETIDSSQPISVSSVYPLRLLYPKSRAPVMQRAQSTPAHHSRKALQQVGRARTFRLRQCTPQSSLIESPSRWSIALHEVNDQSRQNVKHKRQGIENENDIKNTNYSEESLPQLAGYPSWATSGTRWSEDDQTSVGKTGSICSSESVITFKRDNNICSENKKGTSFGLKEEETVTLPKFPMSKSKNKSKEKGVSLWPTEDQISSLAKIPEVKSLKNNKPTQRRKTFSGAWTPANYDIPDPIADIKKKGIYAPLGLYSSGGESRQRSKSAIKAK